MSAATKRKLAQHTVAEADKLLHLWTVAVKEGVIHDGDQAVVADALLDLRSAASVFVPSTQRQEAAA